MSYEEKLNKVKPTKPRDGGGQSEILKKFKQSPFVFIGTVLVLILVIITFVFWGAGDWILPKAGALSDDELTFGYYDNVPIELKPGSFFAEQRKYYAEQIRGNERYATERAFNAAVIRAAVLNIMGKDGYEPPKELVDRKVAELPRYQEEGKFSLLRWRNEPASTRREIQKYVHDDLITSRYYADAAARELDEGRYAYSVLTSSKEADFIGGMTKVRRNFKIAVFPYSSYPKNELLAFVKKNESLFKTVKLSQITLSGAKDSNEIQKVLDSIKNGSTTFEDAAKNHSDDSFKQAGGNAGQRFSFELRSLVPDEAERAALIALKQGEMSVPIKLASGWGIFRADAAAADADTEDEVALEKLRAYINENERGIVEDWLIAQAKNFAARAGEAGSAAQGWEEAVIAFNVDSKDFGPVPLNYGDSTLFARVRDFSSDIPSLSGAGTSENFWKNAFSTPVGKISQPFVISSGDTNVVLLLPVDESTESEEAVKNTVSMYKTSFIENEIFRGVEDAIKHSDKFVNNFEEKYGKLFSPQFSF